MSKGLALVDVTEIIAIVRKTASKFNMVIQLNNILSFLPLCLPSILCFNTRMKVPEFSCLHFLSHDTNRIFEVSKTGFC